jgi:hypothetical protein
MATTRKSYLNFNRAYDLMGMDARPPLNKMHVGGKKLDWFVVHPHGGPVTMETAERLKKMPDIVPSNDGLLPGAEFSQTFRRVRS